MKTLALIKNPLFDSFIKIVATDNLEKTLDNPDVPVPFTCLDSVTNQNSDLLLEQLSSYFINHKLSNKDFFNLGEEETNQLTFMMNLIKLSSGANFEAKIDNQDKNSFPVSNTTKTQEVKDDSPKATENTNHIANVSPSLVEKNTTVQETLETKKLEELDEDPFAIVDNVKTEVKSNKNELIENLEEDPFAFKTEAIQSKNKVENTEAPDDIFDPFTIPTNSETSSPENKTNLTSNSSTNSATVTSAESNNSGEMITEFNIPKNSTLHFFKNEAVTATLIDASHVIFDGETLSLNDSAKAAYKKSGTLGIANGLSNWLYNGTALKSLKS